MISAGEINIKALCEANSAVSAAGKVTECKLAVDAAHLKVLTEDCRAVYGNEKSKTGKSLADGCRKTFGDSVWESPVDVNANRVWDPYHDYYTRHGLGGQSAGYFYVTKIEEFAATLKKGEKEKEIDLSDPLAAKEIVKKDKAAAEELNDLSVICNKAKGEAKDRCLEALNSILEQILQDKKAEGLIAALKESDKTHFRVEVEDIVMGTGYRVLKKIKDVKKYLEAVAGAVEEKDEKAKKGKKKGDEEPYNPNRFQARGGLTAGPNRAVNADVRYLSPTTVGQAGTDVCSQLPETCGFGADGTNPDFTPAEAEGSQGSAPGTSNSDFTPAGTETSVSGIRRMGPSSGAGASVPPALGQPPKTEVEYTKVVGALLEMIYSYVVNGFGPRVGLGFHYDYYNGTSKNPQVTGWKNSSSHGLGFGFIVGAVLFNRFGLNFEWDFDWQHLSDPIPQRVAVREGQQPPPGELDLGLRSPGATFGRRYAGSIDYCAGDYWGACLKFKVGVHDTDDNSNLLEHEGRRFENSGLSDRWFAELAILLQHDFLGGYLTPAQRAEEGAAKYFGNLLGGGSGDTGDEK